MELALKLMLTDAHTRAVTSFKIGLCNAIREVLTKSKHTVMFSKSSSHFLLPCPFSREIKITGKMSGILTAGLKSYRLPEKSIICSRM